jgi:hypothetical protein
VRKRRKEPQLNELSMEFDGKTFLANYSVSSGVVTVTSIQYGQTSTLAGGSRAETIARVLFREMLEGTKSRGRL